VADWDSADLLSRFNDEAARPSSDEYTATQKYALLADGQEAVYQDIAKFCPHVLYGTPTALTAASDLKSFTFGTDVMPIGLVELYPSLAAIPDDPLVEGIDYLSEGMLIRTLNNQAWTRGTIYGRWIQMPARIAVGQAPTLTPKQARTLIVHKALELFGRRGAANLDLAAVARAAYDDDFARWLLLWKNQFFTQGTQNDAAAAWWRHSPDLG